MVLIRISDEVWQIFRDSWALMGVRTHEELVHMLEEDLWDKSWSVLDDAKRHLVDHTPEAYVRREIGLEEERKQGIKRVDKKGEKSIGENLLEMFSEHPEVLQEVFPGARLSDEAMSMVRSETAKASTSIGAHPERAGKKRKDRKRKHEG